jgi:hypothetical protein
MAGDPPILLAGTNSVGIEVGARGGLIGGFDAQLQQSSGKMPPIVTAKGLK